MKTLFKTENENTKFLYKTVSELYAYNGGDKILAMDEYGNTRGEGTSGTVYFVDGNSGADTNNGKSWKSAFKTLAVAFAASHADIARGSDRWARRNKIYIAGDSFIETLVIFPQKTDVIGVGSMNGFSKTSIEGNHAPVNAGFGCRFYNVQFEPTTAADLMTLTGACWGAEFHGCDFLAYGSTSGLTATGGILTTACTMLKVEDCEFLGSFANEYIDIAAGAIDGMSIIGNTMTGGADNGIMVSGTGTYSVGRRGVIANNMIECADIFIDVNATSVFNVMNNTCISGEALGSSSYVIDLTFACNNVLTGNGVSATLPVGSSS